MRGLTAGIGILAFTLACFAQHHPSGSSGSSSERSASESRSSDSSSAHAGDSGAGHTASSPGSNRGSTDSSSSRSESATAPGRAATERNDAQTGDGRMHMSGPPTGSKHGKPASNPPVAGNDQKNTAQPKSKDSIHLLQLIAACRANGGFVVNGHCLPPGVVGLGPRYCASTGNLLLETQLPRACKQEDGLIKCGCWLGFLP